MPTRNVVTIAPRARSATVAQTVSTAQRCSHRGRGMISEDRLRTLLKSDFLDANPFSLMMHRVAARHLAVELLRLRQVVLPTFRRGVFIRTAINDGRRLVVAVRRRRRSGPLQRVRLPGIAARLGAPEQAVEEIDQED